MYFFFKSNFKMALIWKKRAIFDLLFTFLVTREKRHKNSFSTFLPYIHTRILLTLLTFLPDQFCKTYGLIMYGFSFMWLLVLILFRAILEQSINKKWWANFRLECLLLIFIYTNATFMVICKPWTLNDGRWRLSPIQKTQKKHCFLVAAILFLSVKLF